MVVDIDDKLMKRAMRLTGLRNASEIVRQGVQLLVQHAERDRIGGPEARLRAKRLVKRNKELFRRLA